MVDDEKRIVIERPEIGSGIVTHISKFGSSPSLHENKTHKANKLNEELGTVYLYALTLSCFENGGLF